MRALRTQPWLGAALLGTGAQNPLPADSPLAPNRRTHISSAFVREAPFDASADIRLKVDLGKMCRGGLDAAFFVVFADQRPSTTLGHAQAVAQAAAPRRAAPVDAAP